MKKEKKMILKIIVGAPILLLILDLSNIRNLIPITDNYDWLGFIGACLSAFGALTLGLISIKQNESLSELNKKMLSNDMISNCYSKIIICKSNYFDIINENYKKDYGYEVISDNIKESKHSYYRFIMQLKDKNELPLSKANITNLKIQYGYKNDCYEKYQNYSGKKQEDVILEVTPNESEETYYMPICVIDSLNNLKEIFDSSKLRITVDVSITNSFGVKAEIQYTLLLHKANIVSGNWGDWTEYYLRGRKAYYGKVMYVENNR